MSPSHRNARPHALRPHAPKPQPVRPHAYNPFANGQGGGVGNADAVWEGVGRWRVFLYLAGGPRLFHVDAPTPQYAIEKAWAALKVERAKEVRDAR